MPPFLAYEGRTIRHLHVSTTKGFGPSKVYILRLVLTQPIPLGLPVPYAYVADVHRSLICIILRANN